MTGFSPAMDDGHMSSAFAIALVVVGAAVIPGEIAGVQRPPAVRDSAGIRIVEHGALRSSPASFRLGERPMLDLGGLRKNEREELDARNPFLVARPLLTGGWVAVDWATLKIFDRQGRYLRTIGRAGDGPGESRQLRDVCVAPGDTLVAISFSERRISVFDSAGTHLRTALIDGQVGPNPCFGDGSFLVRREAVPNPASKASPGMAALVDRVSPVHRVRWNGTVVGAIGLLPERSWDLTFEEVANISVRSDRIHVGNGSAPEYRVYSGTGKLLQIVRWNSRRITITSQMRESAIRRGFAPGRVEREHFPVYASIQLGPDDVVWVQDYPVPPGNPEGYTVFDRSGGLLGRVETPPLSRGRVEVQWIGEDRVLLGWRDEDGAPHLSLHSIVRK